LSADAVQVSVADPSPGVAVTLVGADGSPAGVAMTAGDEAALVPAALVAVTVNEY
jgi:hypothetical protein